MSFVKPTEPPAFTLVHISDFHVCRPEAAPLSAYVNKRALSVLSWKIRRAREHHPRVFQALAAGVERIAADQIVVTGDVTQLGLPAEFEQVQQHLALLGPPGRVFMIPGNHDALVAAPSDPFAPVADYLSSDSPLNGSGRRFPTSRTRGRVALIGVSSARPTPPWSAAGRVGPEQLARLEVLLRSCATMFRVILIHHPPLDGGIAPRKRLLDAAELRSVIERCGAELILHGHTHRCSNDDLTGPRGLVPVLGISSATAADGDRLHRAVFRVFRIVPTPEGWSTTLQDHAYDPGREAFLPEPASTLR